MRAWFKHQISSYELQNDYQIYGNGILTAGSFFPN